MNPSLLSFSGHSDCPPGQPPSVTSEVDQQGIIQTSSIKSKMKTKIPQQCLILQHNPKKKKGIERERVYSE